MTKNKDELIKQLKEEFPEIFEGEIISLHLAREALILYKQQDEDIIVRRVLIEKTGNISGKMAKLLKVFNRLVG
jgi:transcription antitermination factor NusA-like protein